jgi:hypothetical protein
MVLRASARVPPGTGSTGGAGVTEPSWLAHGFAWPSVSSVLSRCHRCQRFLEELVEHTRHHARHLVLVVAHQHTKVRLAQQGQQVAYSHVEHLTPVVLQGVIDITPPFRTHEQ